MRKVYGYTISQEANEAAFQNACKKIEHFLPQWDKHALLTDVDGTLIQTYHKDNRSVDVFNDYEVDAVFVDAEIKLDDIFGPPVKVFSKESHSG